MTLNQLLYEIREKFSEVVAELEEYMYIPEVERFVKGREKILREFEDAVKGYSIYELTGNVLNSLRSRGMPYKIYGICSRGAEYFEVTKQVEKAIKEYEKSLLEAYQNNEQNEETLMFDSAYAIPDELDEETFNKLYGEKITG